MNSSLDATALCASLDDLAEDDSSRVPIMIQLLILEGHDRHEDIVFDLGLIGDPAAIPAIAKAAETTFQYMVRWQNLHEFQRKCAYALARIGTPESREVLEHLAQHSDPHLREYGLEGLEHWPMPFARS
ncbi:HEAT repeat domain-containing protein [Acidovorax kalamii]|uniref:HEAT repeat domain-containing protein n=1 Tax=Acidovorax kalamii TaxID=2004485 RepID=UPI002090E211|nr:HEAT repeat domain-containing protein [Acidovorax kalamii]MCO5358882.1 HEAT repeat domain-containing protein [Acidovorax kalamii]